MAASPPTRSPGVLVSLKFELLSVTKSIATVLDEREVRTYAPVRANGASAHLCVGQFYINYSESRQVAIC